MSIPIVSPQPWRAALAAYLAAAAADREAEQAYHRAGRVFAKLARRVGDRRAYEIAGLSMADWRSINAGRARRKARDRLKVALAGAPVHRRLAVIGVVLCADLPRPANDSVGGSR